MGLQWGLDGEVVCKLIELCMVPVVPNVQVSIDLGFGPSTVAIDLGFITRTMDMRDIISNLD